MKFYGKAEQAASQIINLFKSGDVPQAMSNLFIQHAYTPHCSGWSWGNRLLVALFGYSDAMGFRSWLNLGRSVIKGQKAMYILAPVFRKITETVLDENTGRDIEKDRSILVAFKSVPVFGYEQTEGEELPGREQEAAFVEALPLVEVARSWGLNVSTYNGAESDAAGYYASSGRIGLGVENLATWAHELVHAAEDRLEVLNFGTADPQVRAREEIVAELGGAVLLHLIGRSEDADLGGCWKYISHYSGGDENVTITRALSLINRVSNAVSLILETAEATVAVHS